MGLIGSGVSVFFVGYLISFGHTFDQLPIPKMNVNSLSSLRVCIKNKPVRLWLVEKVNTCLRSVRFNLVLDNRFRFGSGLSCCLFCLGFKTDYNWNIKLHVKADSGFSQRYFCADTLTSVVLVFPSIDTSGCAASNWFVSFVSLSARPVPCGLSWEWSFIPVDIDNYWSFLSTCRCHTGEPTCKSVSAQLWGINTCDTTSNFLSFF